MSFPVLSAKAALALARDIGERFSGSHAERSAMLLFDLIRKEASQNPYRAEALIFCGKDNIRDGFCPARLRTQLRELGWECGSLTEYFSLTEHLSGPMDFGHDVIISGPSGPDLTQRYRDEKMIAMVGVGNRFNGRSFHFMLEKRRWCPSRLHFFTRRLDGYDVQVMTADAEVREEYSAHGHA
jgi:hypothetical protein